MVWMCVLRGMVLLLVLASGSAGAALWPYPLAETEIALGRCLSVHGFEVRRTEPEIGAVQLQGRKGHEIWTVTLRQASPLATVVASNPKDSAREALLKQFLMCYRKKAGNGPPPVDDPAPPEVIAVRAAVVCIEASKGLESLQFSGVAINRDGTVLTTAHNLQGLDEVTVRWHGGATSLGRIVRTDPEHDLSLVQTTTPPPGYVDLARARLVVGHGESVYAVGCPSHRGETVRSGRARMPMRRVGAEVLWELELQTLPGSSGSPVFDAAGRLFGMVKGRWRGEDSRGLAIPSEALLRFVSLP